MRNIFHGSEDKYLVFDIGGTSVKCGMFNNNGELLNTDKITTPNSYIELINLILNKCKTYNVKSISMGIPGVIDYQNQKVIHAPNLSYLINKLIVKDLAENRVKCFIENDANLAALGEYYKFDKKYENLILVTLGTGVGGGAVVNGKLFKGLYSNFEIGHITIQTDGYTCGCGKKGCFEAYCSKSGIERIYTDLSGEFLSANNIFQNTFKNDHLANVAVSIYSKYLGIGLSSIANIFFPEIILIGGGLSEVSNYFFKSTIKVFSKNIFNAYKNKTYLKISKLKNKAALYGGYFLLRQASE